MLTLNGRSFEYKKGTNKTVLIMDAGLNPIAYLRRAGFGYAYAGTAYRNNKAIRYMQGLSDRTARELGLGKGLIADSEAISLALDAIGV